MEAIVKQQVNNDPISEVRDLDLSEWKGTEFSVADKKLIESFPELEMLSMRGCGLTSLKNFPTNKNLQKVDLSENNISGGLKALVDLKELIEICIGQNKISTFDELMPLKELPELLSLELEGNPLAEDAEYPAKIFEMLENVKIVDQKDADGNAVEDEDDEDDEDDDDDSAMSDPGDSEEDGDVNDDSDDDPSGEEKIGEKRPRNFKTDNGTTKK